MTSLYTNCMYNFMQTKISFPWSGRPNRPWPIQSGQEEGQGRLVQWYTQNTLHEIVISLYTQPPTHLVASDIQ